MVFVVAALVLVTALALINLLLTLGLVRRLREQAELLSARGGGDDHGVLPAGATIGEFATAAVDGTAVTSRDLSPDTAVGFFSPQCQPCRDRLPEFVSMLESVPAAERKAVAVVLGDRSDAAEMVAQLAPVARVVTGKDAEPVVRAFDTESYPALYRMGPDGRIAASGHGMSVFPALAAA